MLSTARQPASLNSLRESRPPLSPIRRHANKMRHIIRAMSSLLAVSVIILAGDSLWEHAKAVTCVNPGVTDAAHAWAVGSKIAVNISNFPPGLQGCVKTAFDNWNNAKIANRSNVTFNVGVDGPKPDLTTQIGVYQVTYQQPVDDMGKP